MLATPQIRNALSESWIVHTAFKIWWCKMAATTSRAAAISQRNQSHQQHKFLCKKVCLLLLLLNNEIQLWLLQAHLYLYNTILSAESGFLFTSCKETAKKKRKLGSTKVGLPQSNIDITYQTNMSQKTNIEICQISSKISDVNTPINNRSFCSRCRFSNTTKY